MLNLFFLSGNWIIWIYIIGVFPFQFYDFLRNKNRKIKDYMYNITMLVLVLLYIYYCLAGNALYEVPHLLSNEVYGAILLFVLINSIVDLFHNRSKRNILFCIILSIFVILFLITYLKF